MRKIVGWKMSQQFSTETGTLSQPVNQVAKTPLEVVIWLAQAMKEDPNAGLEGTGLELTLVGLKIEPVWEHSCEENLEFRGQVAAPGIGTSWECTVCHRGWQRVGPTLVPEDEMEPGDFELTLEDVR